MNKGSLIINTKQDVIYIPMINTSIANKICKEVDYKRLLEEKNIYYEIYKKFTEYSGENLVAYDIKRKYGIKNLSNNYMYINEEDEIINIEFYNSKDKKKHWIELKAKTKKWDKY